MNDVKSKRLYRSRSPSLLLCHQRTHPTRMLHSVSKSNIYSEQSDKILACGSVVSVAEKWCATMQPKAKATFRLKGGKETKVGVRRPSRF